MPDHDPRKLAQAERTLCWSVRSCVTSLVVTAAAVVLALLDVGGRSFRRDGVLPFLGFRDEKQNDESENSRRCADEEDPAP